MKNIYYENSSIHGHWNCVIMVSNPTRGMCVLCYPNGTCLATLLPSQEVLPAVDKVWLNLQILEEVQSSESVRRQNQPTRRTELNLSEQPVCRPRLHPEREVGTLTAR
jgi:hypothetical protein